MLARVRLLKVRQLEVLVTDLDVARTIEAGRRAEVELRVRKPSITNFYSTARSLVSSILVMLISEVDQKSRLHLKCMAYWYAII